MQTVSGRFRVIREIAVRLECNRTIRDSRAQRLLVSRVCVTRWLCACRGTGAVTAGERDLATGRYDATRNVVVLFGGSRPGQDFSDTWEWNGQRWTEMTPR